MEELYQIFPPRVLAIGIVTIGFIVIVLFAPPRTACDAQIELFKSSQEKFIFGYTKDDYTFPAEFDRLLDDCGKSGGVPGGCGPFLAKLKSLADHLRTVPQSCMKQLSQEEVLLTDLQLALRSMTLIAWGEKPPATYVDRVGWLDKADVYLYCKMKSFYGQLAGVEAWNELKSSIMSELPGAKDLSRDQIWNLTLLSIPCESL